MTPPTQIRIPEEIRIRAGLEPGVYSLKFVMDRIEATDPFYGAFFIARHKTQTEKLSTVLDG